MTTEQCKMKAEGLPCTNGCGKWVNDTDYVCPICQEDVFCSSQCFWSGVIKCAEYGEQKNDMPSFTPRSVMGRMFRAIQSDSKLIKQLRDKRKAPSHMLVLYVRTAEDLTLLLGNNPSWKETILLNVESQPRQSPPTLTDCLCLAVYCAQTRELETRLIL